MAYQNHSIQMGNILWNHLSFSTIIWSTGHCITQSTEMGKYTVEPPQFHYNWMTSHSHFNILYNKPRINRVPVRVETSACWIFQVFVETCAMNKLMLLRPNFGMPKCSTTSVAAATALSRLKPKPTTSYSRSCYGLARQSAGFFVTGSPAIKLQLRLCKPVIARVYHGYPQPRAHRFSFTYLPRPTQNKVSHIVLYVSTNLFLFLASNNQV